MSERSGEQQGIVTPEAVVLDFNTAGVGSRVAAAIIDAIVIVTGILVSFLILYSLGDSTGPAWVGVVVGFFLAFAFLFAYPALFETFMHGKTPGKAALGLQVVTVEGGPISFRHAAIRSALGVVELFGTSGAIAVLVVFFSKRNQRLGDMLAGTLVLRQRSGSGTPQAVSFVPVPGTEDFAASIDVSGMTTDEYQTVREFLLRSSTITPDSANALAVQIANQMVARLRLSPPHWMTPMTVLIDIAAAYQRRFQGTHG